MTERRCRSGLDHGRGLHLRRGNCTISASRPMRHLFVGADAPSSRCGQRAILPPRINAPSRMAVAAGAAPTDAAGDPHATSMAIP